MNTPPLNNLIRNDIDMFWSNRLGLIHSAADVRLFVCESCRYLVLTLTTHQHFPGKVLYRIKSIIFAQQFAFRYPPDIVNFSGLNS